MIIENLKNQGAIVRAYDPVVWAVKGIELFHDLRECISASEIVITATEWKDFSDMDTSILKGKKVFDLRRVFVPKEVILTMGVGIGKD